MVQKTRLLSYGEDALTLWAVTERLDLILGKLGDNSDPSDCIIFYRPSFGRDQYGEFDAIVITPEKTYLVESKWDGSGDLSKGLEEHQIRRHKILRWYHDNWKGELGDDWDEFARKNNPAFKKKFTYFVKEKGKRVKKSKYIPSSSDLLGQNLQTILEYIRRRDLRDILIFFHRGEMPEVETDFDVVQIKYEPKFGNYIELLREGG
jgi:hypothetical protein